MGFGVGMERADVISLLNFIVVYFVWYYHTTARFRDLPVTSWSHYGSRRLKFDFINVSVCYSFFYKGENDAKITFLFHSFMSWVKERQTEKFTMSDKFVKLKGFHFDIIKLLRPVHWTGDIGVLIDISPVKPTSGGVGRFLAKYIICLYLVYFARFLLLTSSSVCYKFIRFYERSLNLNMRAEMPATLQLILASFVLHTFYFLTSQNMVHNGGKTVQGEEPVILQFLGKDT